MNLGVQYYRAPFPEEKYWADDFAKIKDSGMNTVQLWVLWAWVESKPGEFRYDDYDKLVELAGQKGLGVILSTIAEIQPYWIHNEVPGSEMIDHRGHKVISSNRGECHFGITPGGCTDNPAVWERMKIFLTRTVEQYRKASNLKGWDAWNELRWNVQSDGLVCFCPHTLAAFRKWLDEKFGGLDNLNRVWKRRYGSFDEIMPGKTWSRPYTEMMAFEHFLTHKCDEHGIARYRAMKALDPDRPITVHAGAPCILWPGSTENHAINRGNDWFYADGMDGVGTSSFPKWGNIDDAGFGMRVECVYSAAQGKKVWLSEVQGGRASDAFKVHIPVDAPSQQRWIWNGLACGADTILFWCWRDEVFGKESAGFGLCGDDGLADERLDAMKVTGRLLEKHEDFFAEYKPVKPEVGVFFSPQTYYLYWAEEASAARAMHAVLGYSRSLVKRSIPYIFVEEAHLNALDGLKILFLPRTIVLDPLTEDKLTEFVMNGGTLVCESECGSFNSQGLYRYPVDRLTAKLSGIREVGRRSIEQDTITVNLAGSTKKIPVTQWLTPWQKGNGVSMSEHEDGSLIVEVPVGKGKLVLCGAYLGDAYIEKQQPKAFEEFVEALTRLAGWKPEIEVLAPTDAFVYTKSGSVDGKNVVFVFLPQDQRETHLRFRPGYFRSNKVKDLIGGNEIPLFDVGDAKECLVAPTLWNLAVLVDSE